MENLADVLAALATAYAAEAKILTGAQSVEFLVTGGPGGANRLVKQKANAVELRAHILRLEAAKARLGGGGARRAAFSF